MVKRWASVRDAGLPYLVAEIGHELVAYAYASTYRPRAAYRYTIEDSVYVRCDARGKESVGSFSAN